MAEDDYGEFFDESEARQMRHDKFMELRRNDRRRKRSAKQTDILNEVGVVPDPTPERLERIEFYKENYVQMHYDLFTNSTGLKPYGQHQIESINRSLDVIKEGGNLISIEPRGFAKTSRTANHALMAVLQGRIKYCICLASDVKKAREILDSIKTELMDNEKLFELYPATMSCFQHLEEKSVRCKGQTYNGEATHIGWGTERIRFPVIPGEPSSGSIIQVRPKNNVRGLFAKVRYGPDSGRVIRPDFAFLDDIQTDEEARNAEIVDKIVNDLKKSVLFGGTHSKRISAIMCATPICAGDVTTRFALHETAWEVIQYKMIERMPINLNMWLNEYAQILLNYDRHERGSRKRAQLKAKQFVLDNYDKLHEGAQVAWDWAYGWAEDPQVEVSALQHAMNFLIEQGNDAFESECQCTIVTGSDENDSVKATRDDIIRHINPVLEKYEVPANTRFIVTHVDVNDNILTALTAASPEIIEPYICNHETYPPQEGALWQKNNLYKPLHTLYPDIPKTERGAIIYQAVIDFLTMLYSHQFRRSDGILIEHSLIMIDNNHMKEEVMKAVNDLPFKTSIQPCYGTGILAKDIPMNEKNYGPTCFKYYHCVSIPNKGYNSMELRMDVNYFKKKVHEGFKCRPGHAGSISLFPETRQGEHDVLIKHLLAEDPTLDYYEKEKRRVYTWASPQKHDNEFFDNLVGCMAGFVKLGAKFKQQVRAPKSSIDMNEYLSSQEELE